MGLARARRKAGMRFEGFVEPAPSSNATAAKQKLYSILKNDIALKNNGGAKIFVNIGVSRSPQQEH